MRDALCSLLLMLTAVAAAAQDSPCQIRNATPAFWKYWEAAKDKPEAEQVALAKKMVIAAHPDLYAPAVLRLPPHMDVDKMIAYGLEKMKPHMAEMRAQSEQIEGKLPQYVRRFQRTFPDFKCSSPVIVMVSFGAFDGAGRDVGGKHALLFGVDVMARTHDQTDLEAFFQHELFHMYQPQVAKLGNTLHEALWNEGLATYVSHVLNPEVAEPMILGLPRDMAEKTRPLLAEMASEVLAHFDSASQEVARPFFMGTAMGGEPGKYPSRSGYYLGYLAAHHISTKMTLREMARLSGARLRQELKAAVEEIAKAQLVH